MRGLAAAILAGGVLMGGQAGAQNLPSGANGPASEPAPYSRINPDAATPNRPPPVSTLVPTRGVSGPRLEVGAVVCRTQADLQHRAQVQSQIANGNPDPGDPMVGCRLMNQVRGVEILSRAGLGRVEVKLKPSGETGWTDAYLP
jgi:hypothetical protein